MQPILVLPLVVGPSDAGSGKTGLQELQRNDFDALILHRINARHTDILEYGQVLDILIAKVIRIGYA